VSRFEQWFDEQFLDRSKWLEALRDSWPLLPIFAIGGLIKWLTQSEWMTSAVVLLLACAVAFWRYRRS